MMLNGESGVSVSEAGNCEMFECTLTDNRISGLDVSEGGTAKITVCSARWVGGAWLAG